jgi:hypothetical protein
MTTIVAFFATTLIEKKGDNSKLVVIAHFRFKQNKNKMGDGSMFSVIALFVVTTINK